MSSTWEDEDVTKKCMRCGVVFQGYKNHTYCRNCFMYIVRDAEPRESFVFICNKCGEFFKSHDFKRTCRGCGSWHPKQQNSIFIYFATDGSGLVKIGKTKDLNKRLSGLKTSNPKIKYLFFFEDKRDFDTEKTIHDKYKDKRKAGEWFDLSKDDIFQVMEEYRVENVTLYELPESVNV